MGGGLCVLQEQITGKSQIIKLYNNIMTVSIKQKSCSHHNNHHTKFEIDRMILDAQDKFVVSYDFYKLFHVTIPN